MCDDLDRFLMPQNVGKNTKNYIITAKVSNCGIPLVF